MVIGFEAAAAGADAGAAAGPAADFLEPAPRSARKSTPPATPRKATTHTITAHTAAESPFFLPPDPGVPDGAPVGRGAVGAGDGARVAEAV